MPLAWTGTLPQKPDEKIVDRRGLVEMHPVTGFGQPFHTHIPDDLSGWFGELCPEIPISLAPDHECVVIEREMAVRRQCGNDRIVRH